METLNPQAWRVVAHVALTRGDWTSTRHLPTFLLPYGLGICSEEAAVKVARDIIDPFKSYDVSIDVYAAGKVNA